MATFHVVYLLKGHEVSEPKPLVADSFMEAVELAQDLIPVGEGRIISVAEVG